MSDLLKQGIFFFNSQRYFEAHEVWEEMWRAGHGSLRPLYQGLIHAAVGLHHLSKENRAGGKAQLEKALAKLDLYPPETAAIEVGQLRVDLRHILNDLGGKHDRITIRYVVESEG